MNKKRLVIGVSGASGIALAFRLLKELQRQSDWESHLVISKSSAQTIELETDHTLNDLIALADTVYDNQQIGEAIASGTFKTEGMIIIPCSMKTLAGISHGYSDNLLLRAADVTIKERRPLVLVTRETPLSSIHLRNMLNLANDGVIIMPPMMTHYIKNPTASNMEIHLMGKILSPFGIEASQFNRWGEQ